MNLPNKISLSRIIMIPFMIFFYLADFIPNSWGKIVALAIFVVASLTDMLDGQIARKRNLITNLGKFLDPIADKLLAISALLLVICDGTVPAPYGAIAGIIIIGRELIIGGFRQVAATKNVVMAADWFGKIKTIVQDISLPFLILLSFFKTSGVVSGTALFVFEIVNWVLLGLSVLLTIVSAINYLAKNWNVLKDTKDNNEK
ncbi:MAG: CDP-diacylglycerol--glycerol-3-phosphate 3-phosphatidyltransferase [Firmicutes bacterium]|nr:CDP-diacylglycerol--glycerol-3-phosphate 3-phosphatidyltransferase [Bacillota bacterium]MDY3659236.1 CDP-diacylglycerol--glycerol-3-phosphate 3-phosphatidyltransferase [Eubacteriales bacterium]